MRSAITSPSQSSIPPTASATAAPEANAAESCADGLRNDEDCTTHLRFATQGLVDGQGRVRATELLFRWNSRDGGVAPALGSYATCAALSHALLDGGLLSAGHQAHPVGDLFVNADERFVLSPLVEALTPDFAVVELLETIEPNAALVARVAALRQRGYRFALDDVDRIDDSRWVLAPHAEWVKLDLLQAPAGELPALVEKARRLELKVIVEKVGTASQAERMRQLGVDLLQGYGVAPVVTHGVPAWPGCDAVALGRMYLQAEQGASVDELAAIACSDAAIVARLSRLHGLLAPGRVAETLPALLAALPPRALLGWLAIFNVAATHGRRRTESRDIWRQVIEYRDAQQGADTDARTLSHRLFSLYRRLIDRQLGLPATSGQAAPI